MNNYFAIPLLFALLSTATNAATLAVNSQTCKQKRGKEAPFILVLKQGENVNAALLKCAQDAQLPSASISALGALKNSTLRYFNAITKQYQDKKVGQNLEIVSMLGNLTKMNGKYLSHIHVALADANYHVVGGHFKDGIVGATTEITIIPMQDKLFRTKDDKIGLNIINS